VDRSIYNYDEFRPYRDAVYLNGAKFLHNLRNLVGDEAFFSFLRDYAIQNKNRITTAADFFEILQENTDEDLDGLINDYFRR
jgi:aminopeptidase N